MARKAVQAKPEVEHVVNVFLSFLRQIVAETIEPLPYFGGKYQRENARHQALEKIADLFGARNRGIIANLYGFGGGGFPYSIQGVAALNGIGPDEVRRLHAEWIASLLTHPTDFENVRADWLAKTPCRCGAKLGEIHSFGCEAEECPRCHGSASACFCAYHVLKLGWGGRTAAEWRRLRKEHGKGLDRSKYVRPLSAEEKRLWYAAVMKKGAIPYGAERRFQ